MSTNRNIGKKGEKIALDYLIHEGYEIIEQNWTIGHKEIDIIAKKDGCYIFIEVKTRKSIRQGMPEESISQSKIRSVTEAARIFLYDKIYKDVRFDVIAIYLPEESPMDFLHIKDAFY
jgi:putative endonuclease